MNSGWVSRILIFAQTHQRSHQSFIICGRGEVVMFPTSDMAIHIDGMHKHTIHLALIFRICQ